MRRAESFRKKLAASNSTVFPKICPVISVIFFSDRPGGAQWPVA
jgi:hypothetical protein